MLLRHRIVSQTIMLCSASTSILLSLPQIEPEFSRPQHGTAKPGKQQDKIYFATSYKLLQLECCAVVMSVHSAAPPRGSRNIYSFYSSVQGRGVA
jgi:hypothetical protein